MQTIQLNNGIEMPLLGYGVYQVSPDECARCVSDSIRAGYRLIDTAQAYGNEEGVGRAVRESGVDRKEFFITTKVWISNAGESRAAASIDESLRRLGTDYIDLLLIHQPFGDYYGTYRAMERAVRDGKVRAIGVSNFYADRFIDLAENVEIKPAVNQMETHVFHRQRELQREMASYGTRLMAWGPFAEGRNGFFDDPVLNAVGKAHGKTSAQVALRYLLQEDVIVIPKSVRPERMAENFDVFDFELTADEMAKIAALDTGDSLFFSHRDPQLVRMLFNYKP